MLTSLNVNNDMNVSQPAYEWSNFVIDLLTNFFFFCSSKCKPSSVILNNEYLQKYVQEITGTLE